MIATRWQRAEGALVFAAVIAVLIAFGTGLPWWLAILIFFVPDLSFAAYLAGPRPGAMAYNFVHLYGTGALLCCAGLLTGFEPLSATGALWVAHAGFDRMLGYGLKAPESFNQTHLGRIGHD